MSDDERAAFELPETTRFVALWYSPQGFVTLQQLTCAEYDSLRTQYDAAADGYVGDSE